jgi:hypothetical protein
MNPALAIAMVVAGGALLALAVLGYLLGWFGRDAAIALGALGLLVETSGALLLVAARRKGGRTDR